MPAEDIAEHAQLHPAVGADQAVLQERGSFGDDLHDERIAQMLVDHPRDPIRHGRGREDRLRVVGESHDFFHVSREARVKHLVSLVQDEILNPAQGDLPLLDHVEDPARGADDQVDASLQSKRLGVIANSAIEKRAAPPGIE